jgi:ABC-type branched-subunit amino acid transport system ATPase component/ABC-type branched-subunit amino acid transport system permease subunit
VSTPAAAAARTSVAVREALASARANWTDSATAGGAIAVAAALAPFVLGGLIATDTLASGAYLALAATGLGLCIGLAGVPSLAQGAFVGTGAFAAAHVLRHTQLPAELCALIGALVAAGLGTAAGFAVRSLDSVRVAVGTWLLTWLVALSLGALPWLSGGAQGLVVPTRRLFGFNPTPLVHYELAVILTGVCALALVALRQGPFGLDLAAAAQHRGAAAALGVPMERLRVGAFTASAFVGGLAGGFAVQLDLVADPTAYGPLLSFELLVAVLVGGAAAALGPSAGVVILGLIALAARALGGLAGVSGSRFQPMLEALLLLAVLTTGGNAFVPAAIAAARRLVPERRGRRRPSAAPPTRRRGLLRADDLTKRFGGVPAVDGVSLELAPASITALIGPNGSGKTTLLRLLAGAVPPDQGRIVLDSSELTAARPAERVRVGLIRTLQSRAYFGELTVLQHALVGTNRIRRHGGALRAVVSTPFFRAENRWAEAQARASLEAVGLAADADRPASELTGAGRPRLMIAAALATNPAVILLDEPSAGAAPEDLERLAAILRRLKADGLAVLLVEHNLGLVRAVADVVFELELGRVVRRTSNGHL